MELRKDPITRSWVVVGHPSQEKIKPDPCPLCPGSRLETRVLLDLPAQPPWQVRVYPHLRPLYRIEGDPARSAEGIYDRMAPIGAHEIVVETQDHNLKIAQMSDEQLERILEAYAIRIADLKRDPRFKYITVFKNQGMAAGEELPHAHSQITATTFVPRRILYELRAAREWFRDRERCVFCDILRQEIRQTKRVVDNVGDYYAFCPYSSRVPYEIWLQPRQHNHQFEVLAPGENRRHLAALLGRTLRRISQLTSEFHMVLHTSPNSSQNKGELNEYWRTISGDYHWHFEILPILESRSKSYSIKEVYFNGTTPEQAAEKLRSLDPGK